MAFPLFKVVFRKEPKKKNQKKTESGTVKGLYRLRRALCEGQRGVLTFILIGWGTRGYHFTTK